MASSSQVTPSWLARLDEMAAEIVPTTVPIETDTLDIIKSMLLAQGDEEGAVNKAAQDIRSYYTARLFPPNDPFYKNLPDHGVAHVVGAVIDHVFELASAISWKDPAHKRLADLLVALKKSAATEFNPENPQLGWDSSNLDWHAAEVWRTFTPNHASPVQECIEAVRTHALLARLVAADLFPADGAWRTAKCVSEGLTSFFSAQGGAASAIADEFALDTPLVRTCRAAIATRYVVVAGSALSRELRRVRGPETELAVRKREWRDWADWLRQLASTSTTETESAGVVATEEWDLKAGAIEAAHKVEGLLSGHE